MERNKKFLMTITLLVFLFIIVLSSCNTFVLQLDNKKTVDNEPYISIVFGRDNSNNISGRETVFYTYDINSKRINEECVIPFESSYASGVVSRSNSMVFYQSNIIPGDYGSGNGIWAYNLKNKEKSLICDEIHEYNDILQINSDTLLVMMVTDKHVIMPALFDIKTREFTYMADANNEPFIYTCGSTYPYYNYETNEITCIFWNEEESYSKEYLSFKRKINHYLAVTSDILVKDKERIFTWSSQINDYNMLSAAQISKNKFLVTMINEVELDKSPEYYILTFEEGKTSFTKTECPYPYAKYVGNICAINEGETFFFYMYGDENGNPDGVYSYNIKTKELIPILLNTPETNGFCISFSIVS